MTSHSIRVIILTSGLFNIEGVNMKTSVGIYCRLSEEDRNKQFESDDSNSIQNQKTMLVQYAIEQGWEIYDIYSDDDYTGADRYRPQFNRLLKDAENHKFDIVLCKTQSRFTRELELVEKYIHGLFPIWGIRFVSIVDNADTANKGNKKSRQINGLVNEWYLEDMSENIRSVLINRRKNGFHIGAFAPYGYKKDPDAKGHLLIDEEAASVVREIFNLFAEGHGKTSIARILNSRQIPNPTEYKRQHGLKYKRPESQNSTLWKYFAIADILSNEVYIGNMVQGKAGSVSYKTKVIKPRPKSEWYRVSNTHEPIIDMELWDRTQALIKQRAKPFVTGELGLFAKKTKCAYCGYILRSYKHVNGTHYLRCPNRIVDKSMCEGSNISVVRLEDMVIKEINRLSDEYLDEDLLEQSIDIKKTNLEKQKKQLLLNISMYNKKIAEYTSGVKNLYLDKVRGIVTDTDYIEISRQFSSEKAQLENLIAETNDKISDLEDKIKSSDNRKDLINRYAHIDHLTREMVDTLIDYIVVGKRITGSHNVPIEIHWNF